MLFALQVVLNVRLLIDEVVLQEDYTQHAAPLVHILINNLGSLFQYVIIKTFVLTCHFCHGNTTFCVFLDSRFSTLSTFPDDFFSLPHSWTNQSYINSCSFDMASIPLAWWASFGSRWSSGNTMGWMWPHMLTIPSLGGGLLSGMIVLHIRVCFSPGWTFMLLTFSTSDASTLCDDEKSNSQIATASGWRYSKISMASLSCSFSWAKSHHLSWFFLG